MLFWLVVVLSVPFSNFVNGRTDERLKVKLPHGGQLIGRYFHTFNGRGIRAFLSVPYAEPPVGELRFKAPVKASSWQGTRSAAIDIPLCTQRDPFRRDEHIVGIEDCLYLNLYAPVEPVKKGLLPVMVFFHGGGWQCGSGNKMFYGPDYLLDHDIIYVSGNFRLGPLGFLSTEQEDCPGNNGLKDQVMILKWVQENVKAFGGDPNRVTVFGESAGGATATYLMMSPLSKGLFHKAISQSGTNLDPWAQPIHKNVARHRAIELGKMMNCSLKMENFKEMIECLRNVSAIDVTSAFYNFFKWDTDPMIPFPPVIEPDLPGAFLTKHPRDIANPHGVSLPWMTGINYDEGAMKTAAFFNDEKLFTSLMYHWDEALEISLYYDHHDLTTKQKLTKEINEFYFNNRKLILETRQNFTDLYTDAWFLSGMDEYLQIRLTKAETQKVGPTYVYLFAQRAAGSFTEIFGGGKETYHGVSHAEELQYLFPIAKDLFFTSIPTKQELEVRKILTKMYVNFAYTSNPTPDGSDLVKWETVKDFPLRYLRIGSKCENEENLIAMEMGLFEERAQFWRKLKAHLPAKCSICKDEL